MILFTWNNTLSSQYYSLSLTILILFRIIIIFIFSSYSYYSSTYYSLFSYSIFYSFPTHFHSLGTSIPYYFIISSTLISYIFLILGLCLNLSSGIFLFNAYIIAIVQPSIFYSSGFIILLVIFSLYIAY